MYRPLRQLLVAVALCAGAASADPLDAPKAAIELTPRLEAVKPAPVLELPRPAMVLVPSVAQPNPSSSCRWERSFACTSFHCEPKLELVCS
jgi:hypothetical protein